MEAATIAGRLAHLDPNVVGVDKRRSAKRAVRTASSLGFVDEAARDATGGMRRSEVHREEEYPSRPPGSGHRGGEHRVAQCRTTEPPANCARRPVLRLTTWCRLVVCCAFMFYPPYL